MYIRIARRSKEKRAHIAGMPDLHEKLLGAVLPLASQSDEELAPKVQDFLLKYQIVIDIWVVYTNDVTQYLFEHGHIEECDFLVKSDWPFVWFPKDMCDVLVKKDFN